MSCQIGDRINYNIKLIIDDKCGPKTPKSSKYEKRIYFDFCVTFEVETKIIK